MTGKVITRSRMGNIHQILNRKYSIESYMGKVNVNLGCGNKPLRSFINADLHNPIYADVILNLDERLPFKWGSVDLLYFDNVMEHINDTVRLIRDCLRVLKTQGYLVVRVPYFKSNHAFLDPTHLHFFTIQSMDYFVLGTFFNDQYKFFDEHFVSKEIYLDPGKRGHIKEFIKRFIEAYALRKPNIFENSILSNIHVFHNIIYVLRK